MDNFSSDFNTTNSPTTSRSTEPQTSPPTATNSILYTLKNNGTEITKKKFTAITLVFLFITTTGGYYIFRNKFSPTLQLQSAIIISPSPSVLTTPSLIASNAPLSSPTPTVQEPISTTTPQPSSIKETDSVVSVMVDDGTLFTVQEDGYHRANTIQILKKFYQTHADIYDFVTIFDDTSPTQSDTHQLVQRTEMNMGDGGNTFDQSSNYGSKGKLKGINKMGNINTINIESDGLYNVIIHETGHQWLVNFYNSPMKSVVNSNNTAHWSPFLDLGGLDPLGGGTDWVDNNDGTCRSFNKVGQKDVYSWLSLYYMGLATAAEVTEKYLLLDQSYEKYFYGTDSNFPCQPTYITINDFTDKIGFRNPEYPHTQKDFTMAFILVVRNSSEPTQEQKDKLIRIAKKLPEHWIYGTRQRSTINSVGINPLYSY